MRNLAVALFVSLSTLACSTTAERCPVRTAVVPTYPPAPLPEERQKAPAPGMEWIAGEWAWTDDHWVFVPGHWLSSPNGRHWQPGSTSDDGAGHLVYRSGTFGCAR